MGKRVAVWAPLLGCLALLAPAGCTPAHDGIEPGTGDGPNITVTIPSNMYGGGAADWTVSWVRGTPPFEISIDMGGGGEPNTFAQANFTPSLFSHTFTMVNPSATQEVTYVYSINVTDARGVGRTWTGTYHVGPAPGP